MEAAVEIFYDDAVEEWGYVIPALSIIGIGWDSEQEARREATHAARSHPLQPANIARS